MRTSILAASLLLTPCAFAQDFGGLADGSQVVPATASTASALISAELRATPTGPELDYFIQLIGLDLDGLQTPGDPLDDVTAVHWHRAPAGSTGPHTLNLFGVPSADDPDLVVDPVAGTLTGTWDDSDEKVNPLAPLTGSTVTLTDALAELLSCGLYVQIHTVAVGSGEIRGQVLPSFEGHMDGDQVVPPEVTTRSANVTASFVSTASGPELHYSIQFFGLDLDGNQTPGDGTDNVTGVHLHKAPAGSEGHHVLNVYGMPAADDADMVADPVASTITGIWDDTDEAINPGAPLFGSTLKLSEQVEALFAGDLYFQVHTSAVSSGEIRGQVVLSVPYPGTVDDIELATGVNGPAASGTCDSAKRATDGDTLNVEISSPDGGLASGIPLLMTTVYSSELLPVNFLSATFPQLHLDPGSFTILFNGLAGPFGSSIVGDGVSLSYLIGSGLAGTTARLQTVVVSPLAADGFLAFTDAHDIVFE